MRSYRGFTLIELLVVIAIIAVIAAIVFPVFATAREKARQTTCASNLRQLGIAVSAYAQDFDETFPSASGGGEAGVTGGWMYVATYPASDSNVAATANALDPTRGTIYPYLKNKQIYICPDDGDGQTTGDSYAYNSCLTTPSPTAPLWPGKVMSSLDKSAGTLLFAEEGREDKSSSTNDALFNMYNGGGGSTTPGYDVSNYSGRHNDGANVLFADSHVKWGKYNALVSANLPTGGGADYCDN